MKKIKSFGKKALKSTRGFFWKIRNKDYAIFKQKFDELEKSHSTTYQVVNFNFVFRQKLVRLCASAKPHLGRNLSLWNQSLLPRRTLTA